jgi:hypothetical protein
LLKSLIGELIAFKRTTEDTESVLGHSLPAETDRRGDGAKGPVSSEVALLGEFFVISDEHGHLLLAAHARPPLSPFSTAHT